MHPLEVLERYWNYTKFRPLQEDIINAVLEGEDTFALLPTGGGKSICFQIPALIKEGLCIVISPLVALMSDQVNNLKNKGIKAMALTSGISHNELDTLLDNCIYGNYKFLYLSPERLQQQLVQERIQRMNVNLIAVDEAHCISQWGHDFRPAYMNIGALRQLQPNANCIALTATAKPEVIEDIINNLDFINPKVFKGSFLRPNITYNVLKTEDKLHQLEVFLNKYEGSSIIYVRNRKSTESIQKYLERKGISATSFHGGIATKDKENRLQLWLNGQKQVMVATNAFGMGIDKPNVKTVIHFNLPESLESYYQEAGRAGRDGSESYAILLKHPLDDNLLKGQFLNNLPDVKFVKYVYNKLCNYLQISYGEGENSRHQINFKDFCLAYEFKAGMAYNALLVLDRNGIISLVQQFNYRTSIQFITSNKHVFSYLENHLEHNILIKVLLRTYGGIFDFETKVNLSLVAKKSELSESTVIAQLKQLEKYGIIALQLANSDSEITFLKPREDDITINPIAKVIEQQNQIKKDQVKAVINYTENTRTCRSIQLLNYFGEQSHTKCGKCSVCLSGKIEIASQPLKSLILSELTMGDKSSRNLLLKAKCNEKELLKVLGELVEINKVVITERNTYRLA